jgi:hypothetical protein
MAVIIQSVSISPNPVQTNQSFIVSVAVEVTQTTYSELDAYTYQELENSGKTYLQLQTATP